jgi:hypothetical protein
VIDPGGGIVPGPVVEQASAGRFHFRLIMASTEVWSCSTWLTWLRLAYGDTTTDGTRTGRTRRTLTRPG